MQPCIYNMDTIIASKVIFHFVIGASDDTAGMMDSFQIILATNILMGISRRAPTYWAAIDSLVSAAVLVWNVLCRWTQY